MPKRPATPPADLPLGEYTGQLGINGIGISLAVPFSFRALSEAKGDLSIVVEDEYTYFAEGNPLVAGATVQVFDAVDGSFASVGLRRAAICFLESPPRRRNRIYAFCKST
jgi:hypothetical protein